MPHDWAGLGAEAQHVTAVLHEAASILRRKGWAQGRFVDAETGAVDACEALAEAVGLQLTAIQKKGVRFDVGPAVLLGAALDRASARTGAPYLSVWNDMPERSLEAVAEMLEAA